MSGESIRQVTMQHYPTIRKQSPDSVPYGDQIARHGYVYVCYDGDPVPEHRVAVAATIGEARRLYRVAYYRDYNRTQAELVATQQAKRRDEKKGTEQQKCLK